MIEPIAYWTPLIAGLAAFAYLLLPIIDLLLRIVELLVKLLGMLPIVGVYMKKVLLMLKPLAKPVIYILSLVIPNVVIIWYFFYLAGISPDRLSEVNFFWAVVAQPTLGVSLYAYAWAKWIYPRLQRRLKDPKSRQDTKPRHESKPRQPAVRASQTPSESSNSGGKK